MTNDSAVNEYRVVQVGCGGMGRGWIGNALGTPGLKIVGLVDIQRAAAEKAAEQFNLTAVVFDTLAEALASTKADIVFDVTVPAAHPGVVIEALQAGRHVLGEKPMADSLESAQQMVSAATESGRTYAVMQNYRYTPGIRAVKSFLDSSQIGEVQEAHADFYIGAHFGGFRDEMDYPLLLDMSIHTFDAARFLTGADPVSVYCHSFNPKRSWYRGDSSAIVIFEMTGGSVFSYRGSWCGEGLHTGWNSHWRLLGERGSVRWDGNETITAESVAPDATPAFHLPLQTHALEVPPMPLNGHAAVMAEFVAALQAKRVPETDCHDNIKSLAMVLAAVKSARTGKKERVEW